MSQRFQNLQEHGDEFVGNSSDLIKELQIKNRCNSLPEKETHLEVSSNSINSLGNSGAEALGDQR